MGEKRETVGRRIFLLFLTMGGAVLLFRHALAPLLVCTVSFLTASLVTPMARRISKDRSPALLSVALAALLFVGIGGLTALLGTRLIAECRRLLAWCYEHREEISLRIENLGGWLEKLTASLPFCSLFEAERTTSLLSEILRTPGERLFSLLGLAAVQLPRLFLLLVISVASTLYLCADYEGVMREIRSLFPTRLTSVAEALKHRIRRVVGIYLRAYLLLGGLTALVVSLGLWILGVPYALLSALAIALVDLLPILGAGSILIPWGLLSLALGNGFLGWGLLLLYALLIVIRQLAEPRLIGKRLGLSPYLSLTSMLFGLWIFGIIGMLLAPMILLFLKEWQASRQSDEEDSS